MEITINLKISAEGIFAEVLKSALKAANQETGVEKEVVGEVKEIKVKKEPAEKPAKEKPAKKEVAATVTLTEIRQFAAASDERKKLLKEILTGLDLEEPKLQFLPEDKYETVFAQLKEGEI